MIISKKTITLRNWKTCTLSSPQEEDALSLLEELRQTSLETNNMGRYAEEIDMDIEKEKFLLAKQATSGKALMISAWIEGRLIGNCGFKEVSLYEKSQHRAEFGIAVLRDYWGEGVGSALLLECISSAKKAGYEYMELEVVSDNIRAIGLYRKFGFSPYGLREKSFKLRDGSYRALSLMSLAL